MGSALPQTARRTQRRATALLLVFMAVLAALVVLGAVLVSGAMKAEADARRVAEDTRRTLGDATALLIQMVNAETGQRGLLLTGDEAYLAPFSGREALVARTLDDLRAGLGGAGSPPHIGTRIDRIGALIEERFALLDAGIAARRAGRIGEAVDIVRSGQGKAAMDNLRAEIDAVSSAAESRLATAYAEADRRRSETARTLAVLFAVVLVLLASAALLGRRAARAETEARLLAEVKQQRDRADLIRRELSHRVKNLFAVIMSIVTTTGRGETDPREAARKTRERIQALARAHALSSGQAELHATRLDDLVRAIVLPYAPPGHEPRIAGPDYLLPARNVTPLGLILNELATNCVKYGSWSRPGGTLSVEWSLSPAVTGTGRAGRALALVWTERSDGASPAADAGSRQGFGTQMIEMSAQQARATLSREWTDSGLKIGLRFEPEADTAGHDSSEGQNDVDAG